MPDDRTLMQQALEALEWCLDALDGASAAGTANTVAALRARLAAPQAQAEMPPLPEPVSIIGHGPLMNFTSVQAALRVKPHGSIKCYAEDDVRAYGEACARAALAAAPEPVPVAQEPAYHLSQPEQGAMRRALFKSVTFQEPEAAPADQAQAEVMAEMLFRHIKHGDEAHRDWLARETLVWARAWCAEHPPADQADARRYRWLRTALDWTPLFSEPLKFDGWAWARLGSRWVGKHLDAAIDAAIVQGGQNVA